MTQSESASAPPRYYGKYRATVRNNLDPMQTGRIMADVTDLGLTLSNLCLPCLPSGGTQAGCFAVPPIGAHVWIEFEQGDPDFPIWSGCFWENATEVPTDAYSVPPPPGGQNIVFQTSMQTTLTLSDSVATPDSGGVVLKDKSGACIVVNSTGIYIRSADGLTIELTAGLVSINGAALTIARA